MMVRTRNSLAITAMVALLGACEPYSEQSQPQPQAAKKPAPPVMQQGGSSTGYGSGAQSTYGRATDSARGVQDKYNRHGRDIEDAIDDVD